MQNNILFLSLRVFGATGGIEKVCRLAGKAISEMSTAGGKRAAIFCMHDRQVDAFNNKYFPFKIFRGFGGSRIKFILASLQKSRSCDTVILSHVNLVLVAWLIKKWAPATRIIMFAHGIEVWGAMSIRKRKMMKCCDHIVPVSHFTLNKMLELHHFTRTECTVLNNCIDPYLPAIPGETEIQRLRSRYGYTENSKVLFTLSRLSSQEKYKGYDKVLEAMVALRQTDPGIRYLLAGGYDEQERQHVESLVGKLGLKDNVIIAGFIPDDELAAHFAIADVYVMPSLQEGFGIVFIEAMYYGIPVIAGNKDGSVDALCNGKLGILTDPLDVEAIRESIARVLSNRKAFIPNRELLMETFGYEQYKKKLHSIIEKVRA
ncbi:MAG: glycosyltransferase family 4 protein [Ferruginibacter sp.]